MHTYVAINSNPEHDLSGPIVCFIGKLLPRFNSPSNLTLVKPADTLCKMIITGDRRRINHYGEKSS